MQVRKREEINDELKWTLEDIYKSEDLLFADLDKLQNIANEICLYNGKLNNKEIS